MGCASGIFSDFERQKQKGSTNTDYNTVYENDEVHRGFKNAMRGFKNHSLQMLVLDEVLGLELSNFSQQLKLKPGIDDDHRVIVAMSNDLWFRGMEVKEEGERRKNSKETRDRWEAMVLRTKPEANQ